MFKVLLIDDEPDIIDFLSYNFKKKGFDVLTAYDGAAGLQKAQADYPDLVITDLLMPRLNGIQFCVEMKKSDATKTIPILMLSASPDDLLALGAMEAGAEMFLSKPVRWTLLFETVGRMLAKCA
jgi:two-component system alkaline phosphatase synthesis response regulator PhoP